MSKKRKRLGLWAAGAAVVLVIVLWMGLGRSNKSAPVMVEASVLKPGLVVATISAPGVIEAADRVEMRTTTNGLVDRVLVKAGDKVKAGQPLVSLDSRAARSQYDQALASVELAQAQLNQLMTKSTSAKTNVVLQLEQAEAGLKSARARLHELEKGASPSVLAQAESAYAQARLARESAEKDYERMKDLYDQGAIPKAQLEASEAKLAGARAQENAAQQQYETVKNGPTDAELTAARAQVTQAQTAYELAQIASFSRKDDEAAAQARLRQAKAQLEAASEALDSTVLRSPIDGEVLSVPVQSGIAVIAGQLMATVGQSGGLVARVEVDEVDVVRLRNGMTAAINTDASMEPFRGTVTFVAPQGQLAAGSSGSSGATFEVKLTVETGLDVLRPGMTVDVEIEVASKEASAVVPLQAVVEEERDGRRERFVYVVKDGKAKRTAVELGLSNESVAEIVSGIDPQDLIITGDYEAFKRLSDGAAVAIKGQAPKKGSLPKEARRRMGRSLNRGGRP